MAFEKRSGGDFAPTHDLKEDGPLVGTYVSTKKVQTKVGEKPIHTFAVAGGAEVQVWGNYRINDLVENIEDENPQPIVRLTYQGQTTTKNGNKVNDILVELSYDEEDATELTAAPAGETDDI
jgi:hypothetical protein